MDLIAKAVTLKSIKLSDPSAKDLLFSAKHAVLYTFDPLKHNWDKINTEGCLAVYRTQTSEPLVLILNRLQPENFLCPLAEIQSIELEGELLMFLRTDNTAHGIWLFDEKERQLAFNLLSQLHTGSNSSSNSSTTSNNNNQLKKISISDLFNSKASSSADVSSANNINNTNESRTDSQTSNILQDLFSKAKMRTASPANERVPVRDQDLSEFICSNFTSTATPTSISDFADLVADLIKRNPNSLNRIHRCLLSPNSN